MDLIWEDYEGIRYKVVRHANENGFHEDTWEFEKGTLHAMMVVKRLSDEVILDLHVNAEGGAEVYAHGAGIGPHSPLIASGPKRWPKDAKNG